MATDEEYLQHYADRDSDEDVAHELGNRTSGDPTLAPYVAPVIATTWACKSCGNRVEVTAEAVERFEQMASICRHRGFDPLRTNEIVWCERCKMRARDVELAQRDEQRRAVAAAIRALREKPEPTDVERLGASIGPCTPDVRVVLDAEALMRRVFGATEGNEMIRAQRESKRGKRKRVAI